MANKPLKLNTPGTRNNTDVIFCCNLAIDYAILFPFEAFQRNHPKSYNYVCILRSLFEVSICKNFRISRTRLLIKTTSAVSRHHKKPHNSQDSEHKFCILASFLCLNLKIMKKESQTKKELLVAFNQSKVIAEACRVAGVTPSAFYFHFYKDKDFRREVLEKRAEQLAERITETA